MKISTIPAKLILVVLLISSCGDDDEAGINFSDAIVGEWECSNNNTQDFVFAQDGAFWINDVPDPDFGTYEVNGSTITIMDALCGFGLSGRYELSFENDLLFFAILEDSCTFGRDQYFTGCSGWAKK